MWLILVLVYIIVFLRTISLRSATARGSGEHEAGAEIFWSSSTNSQTYQHTTAEVTTVNLGFRSAGDIGTGDFYQLNNLEVSAVDKSRIYNCQTEADFPWDLFY